MRVQIQTWDFRKIARLYKLAWKTVFHACKKNTSNLLFLKHKERGKVFPRLFHAWRLTEFKSVGNIYTP